MDAISILQHDRVPLAYGTADEIFHELLRIQNFSFHYATTHGGYSVQALRLGEPAPTDLPHVSKLERR